MLASISTYTSIHASLPLVVFFGLPLVDCRRATTVNSALDIGGVCLRERSLDRLPAVFATIAAAAAAAAMSSQPSLYKRQKPPRDEDLPIFPPTHSEINLSVLGRVLEDQDQDQDQERRRRGKDGSMGGLMDRWIDRSMDGSCPLQRRPPTPQTTTTLLLVLLRLDRRLLLLVVVVVVATATAMMIMTTTTTTTTTTMMTMVTPPRPARSSSLSWTSARW